MQELFKSMLGLSLEMQKAYTNCFQHSPAISMIDYWANTPIGEYYCDLALDLFLKMHYWPMYLAGREDQTNRWFSQLLSGNVCSPGVTSRPMTQAEASSGTV